VIGQTARRTDRIELKLRVEATGLDSKGREFVEQASTIVMSRHGALLQLKHKLAPDQTLTLRRSGARDGNQEAQVRVVAEAATGENGQAYCVTFLDQSSTLWGVEFPPKERAEEALGRLLLECTLCGSRHLGYLTELELRSYEAHRSVARHCTACGAPTIWKQAVHENAVTLGSAYSDLEPREETSPAPAPQSQAGQRKKRIRTRLSGCARQAGADEELVVCENISGGGLCFRSRKRYAEGERIEIAVPYAPGTANIFVPARIIYVQEVRAAGLHRHGVAYLPR